MIGCQSYAADVENIRDPLSSLWSQMLGVGCWVLSLNFDELTDIRGFQPRINMIGFQSYASDVELCSLSYTDDDQSLNIIYE